MRAEREEAQKQAEHKRKLEAEKAQQAYEKEMKEMAQKDRKERLEYFNAKKDSVVDKLDRVNEELKTIMGQNEAAIKQSEVISKQIAEDEELQKQAMADCDKELDIVRQKMQKGEDEIAAAIAKTGQTESNVGKFLVLAAQMSKATMATTAKSNKLEAQLTTFGELVTRETRSKLAISTYFEEHECLKPFVPALKAGGFGNMDSLKCATDEEFQEIVNILDAAAVDLQNRIDAAEQSNDDQKTEQKAIAAPEPEPEPETEDPEAMLKKYKLGKFWETLEDEGWDDPESWPDLTDDDLLEMGFKKGNINKFRKMLKKESPDDDAPASNLTALQMRLMKRICRNPESWQELEQAREAAARDSLSVLSDLLGDFFLRIDGGMKEAEQYLEIGGAGAQLSAPQMKAIEAANAQPSDEKVDFDEREQNARSEWQLGSEVEVYSKVKQCWRPGIIDKIDAAEDAEEKDGEEWMTVVYDAGDGEGRQKRVGRLSQWVRPPLIGSDVDAKVREDVKPTEKDLQIATQSEALTNASIVAINVTDSMKDKFEANPTALRALTVATGVQDCCMGIIKGQSALRRSLLMVEEIRSMKPADLTEKAAELWGCMDKGSISIMKTALKMTQVTAKFFGFFMKFRQSFQFYLANSERPMVIACEYLIQDCQAFSKFNKEFTTFVAELNEKAVNVITECVEKGIGIENFETAQREREQNKELFLAAQQKYDAKLAEWRMKLDKKHAQRIELEADKVQYAFKLEVLEEDQKVAEAHKVDLEKQIREIEKQKV